MDVRDDAIRQATLALQRVALDHIGARVRDYRRLMAHWNEVLSGTILEIDYEELVADPARIARRVPGFAGLDWHPACPRPHETRRTVRTANVVQVREPIHRRAVERWRNYEAYLGPPWRHIARG